MRLTIALTIAAVAIIAAKLYRDSHIWRSYPDTDDRDWLFEVDPYIASLRRRA